MARLWNTLQSQGLTDEYERHLEKDPSALSYKIPDLRTRVMWQGYAVHVCNCSLLGGCVVMDLLPEARWLLQRRHEFNLDEVVYDGMTLLSFSVSKESREMVSLLLEHGASVPFENSAGETVLEHVRKLLKKRPKDKDIVESIKQLLEKKWVEQRARAAKRRIIKHATTTSTTSNDVRGVCNPYPSKLLPACLCLTA